MLVQHKEKDFLVAFGGTKKEPSNQVEDRNLYLYFLEALPDTVLCYVAG